MSMLTTTQGVIADELEAYEDVIWFTSAYLVSMSSLSPLAGKLSYVIAPRFLMFFATIILGMGSLITGFANSLAVFLLGRALSGIGAAGLLSVSIVLVIQLTSQKRRGLAVGLVNTAFTVGVAAGAIIAGALEPIVGKLPQGDSTIPLWLLLTICMLNMNRMEILILDSVSLINRDWHMLSS
jgi:MFS family permease